MGLEGTYRLGGEILKSLYGGGKQATKGCNHFLLRKLTTWDTKQRFLFGKLEEGYNHLYNILRLFDVLPNFRFTASETMGTYYYKHGIYELPHELTNNLRLRILGN